VAEGLHYFAMAFSVFVESINLRIAIERKPCSCAGICRMNELKILDCWELVIVLKILDWVDW